MPRAKMATTPMTAATPAPMPIKRAVGGFAGVALVGPGIVFDDGCMIGFFRMGDCPVEHFPALPRRLVLERDEWRFVFFLLP